MEVKVHSIHFNAREDLLDFVEGRVNKLDQFADNIINSEVFLRVENTKDSDNKVAEIKVHLPGRELFAKKTSKSFEESTDEAVDALRRQIRKYKEKLSEKHPH